MVVQTRRQAALQRSRIPALPAEVLNEIAACVFRADREAVPYGDLCTASAVREATIWAFASVSTSFRAFAMRQLLEELTLPSPDDFAIVLLQRYGYHSLQRLLCNHDQEWGAEQVRAAVTVLKSTSNLRSLELRLPHAFRTLLSVVPSTVRHLDLDNCDVAELKAHLPRLTERKFLLFFESPFEGAKVRCIVGNKTSMPAASTTVEFDFLQALKLLTKMDFDLIAERECTLFLPSLSAPLRTLSLRSTGPLHINLDSLLALLNGVKSTLKYLALENVCLQPAHNSETVDLVALKKFSLFRMEGAIRDFLTRIDFGDTSGLLVHVACCRTVSQEDLSKIAPPFETPAAVTLETFPIWLQLLKNPRHSRAVMLSPDPTDVASTKLWTCGRWASLQDSKDWLDGIRRDFLALGNLLASAGTDL
jgi:hypothetical protein